ncbi:hypothetical protein Q7A53_14680 [Halobacillus rhizosphaerae]|uniref:hypothetical protein n=1 Tax=Halobacillus rhizosphaerae TaxID=3064889 RepID=UPI00398A873D
MNSNEQNASKDERKENREKDFLIADQHVLHSPSTPISFGVTIPLLIENKL